MSGFLTRLVTLAAVIGLLFFYNTKAESFAQTNEANRLAAEQQQQEALAAAGVTEETGAYNDGVYTGEAQGFGGTISVAVTIEESKISDIEITSASGEDSAYLSTAVSIIDDILSAQTSDVDTVSGATFSSTGIKNAVTKALKQAVKS